MQETFLRAWRGRPLRGPSGAALLAVPDRDECLPGHAEGASGGRRRWTSGPAREPTGSPAHAARGHVDPAVPDPARANGRVAARDDPAGLHRRAAAPAAPPACRADPVRGLRWQAARSGVPRHERRVGQQRLQRARATLDASDVSATDTSPSLDEADAELLARYVEAFERYDIDALTSLIHEDATQSMPPFELWLSGRATSSRGGSGRASAAAARAWSRPWPQTARRRSGSTSRARPAGLRALGAAGARGVGRQDRRAHVLPRHRDAVSALRSAARLDALVRQDVAQAHERDELEQLGRAWRSRTRRPYRRAASWSRASASTVTASTSTLLTSQRATSAPLSLPGVCRRGRTARAGRPGRSGLRLQRPSLLPWRCHLRRKYSRQGRTHRPMNSAACPRLT